MPGARFGVSSVATNVAMLGQSATSWAFASSGRKCGGGGGFLPFGAPFGIGDEVTYSDAVNVGLPFVPSEMFLTIASSILCNPDAAGNGRKLSVEHV